jgi:hypothetical protein
VQVDPAALELELVDLALAVIFAAGLEGEYSRSRGGPEPGQQFSYRHPSLLSTPVNWSYWVSVGRRERWRSCRLGR